VLTALPPLIASRAAPPVQYPEESAPQSVASKQVADVYQAQPPRVLLPPERDAVVLPEVRIATPAVHVTLHVTKPLAPPSPEEPTGLAVSEAVNVADGAPPVAVELPETPTRAEIVSVIGALKPQLSECVGGQHGIVDLTITVAGSGHVTYALASGDLSAVPMGGCMVRVLRAASFPAFANPTLKITYPVAL
jgi:hypothetical protein